MIDKINDFETNFRKNDELKRLRTQALIEIFEAKHRERKLAKSEKLGMEANEFNSQAELDESSASPVKTQKGQKNKGKEKVKKIQLDPCMQTFAERRHQRILDELKFDLKEAKKKTKDKAKRKQAENEEEERCIPIISDLSKSKLSWDLFIVTLAIITSFSSPIEFIFKELENDRKYLTATYIVDCLFIFDIFVNFRTTFINHEGQEVQDVWRIARRYVTGMFFFDFFSSIPITSGMVDAAGKWIKYFKLLKIVRIKKLNSVIQRLELKEDQKAVSDP